MKKDTMRIVPLPEEGIEVAAAVMACAFFDEPLFMAGYPDQVERARVLPWIAQWTFRFGLGFGTVLVSEDYAGAAIAYQATEPIFSEARVAATEHELREQLGPAAWDHYERMVHIWDVADKHLSQVVDGPHWYLDMLAVDPARQRTGIGSALLRAGHVLAEMEGLPTALLTFRAPNVPYYERHGYEVVAAGTEPNAGLDYWGLRRIVRADAL